MANSLTKKTNKTSLTVVVDRFVSKVSLDPSKLSLKELEDVLMSWRAMQPTWSDAEIATLGLQKAIKRKRLDWAEVFLKQGADPNRGVEARLDNLGPGMSLLLRYGAAPQQALDIIAKTNDYDGFCAQYDQELLNQPDHEFLRPLRDRLLAEDRCEDIQTIADYCDADNLAIDYSGFEQTSHPHHRALVASLLMQRTFKEKLDTATKKNNQNQVEHQSNANSRRKAI